MSKDLLKEAIADAKAVRETAIANAKLALEEAFTPKLQSMLSAKLQEDDMEDEVEDEVPTDDLDVDAVEMAHGDEEEPDTEGAYGEGEHDAADDEEVADDTEADLQDQDEIPGEEDEHNYDSTHDEGTDLELEAIIRELDGEEGEEEEPVHTDGKHEVKEEDEEDDGHGQGDPDHQYNENIDLDEVIKSLTEEDDEEEAPADDTEAELQAAYETIQSLKSTLQEVNLLNAKLLFSNKLFKGNSLSESQKMKIIETFDRASNLREVKLVYTTLAESFTGTSKKTRVTEGLASKKSNSTAPKGKIVESNGMADRMKRLAGLL